MLSSSAGLKRYGHKRDEICKLTISQKKKKKKHLQRPKLEDLTSKFFSTMRTTNMSFFVQSEYIIGLQVFF